MRIYSVKNAPVAAGANPRRPGALDWGMPAPHLTSRSAGLLAVALGAALFAACAHQPGVGPYMDAPGFFPGLLHGLIAPFAFVGSLFMKVRMYAWPNSGAWYDFGFLIGLGVWGGGAAARPR